MIWQIYSFLILIGFIIIIAVLTNKNRDELAGTPGLLLIAAILFGAIAMYSFEVTYVECENRIDYMNVTGHNVTRMTNNISCLETNYNYSPLAYFFGGIAVVCFLLTFYYAITLLKVGKKTFNR
jgi:hypothetical protein